MKDLHSMHSFAPLRPEKFSIVSLRFVKISYFFEKKHFSIFVANSAEKNLLKIIQYLSEFHRLIYSIIQKISENALLKGAPEKVSENLSNLHIKLETKLEMEENPF